MTSKTKSTAGQDAITLLMNDHREVEKDFAEFERLSSGNNVKEKKALANHIGAELLKHMSVEEDIFYPALGRNSGSTEDMVNEGIVEHANARHMISEISAMSGDEALFDTKVKVLNELVEHHVEEEETDMFPRLKNSFLDLEALGREMAAHKAHL